MVIGQIGAALYWSRAPARPASSAGPAPTTGRGQRPKRPCRTRTRDLVTAYRSQPPEFVRPAAPWEVVNALSGYDRPVSDAAALVDEVANELDTWPGVHIERLSENSALVRYQELELGFLDRDRGIAELRFAHLEHDELVEHGDASPADSKSEAEVVSHNVEGPSDVTGVLGLFDRRYRELRGEEYPDSVE